MSVANSRFASGALSKIAEQSVVGAPAASFDFQNIPATFKTLRLVLAVRTDTAVDHGQIVCRFNNDATNIYDSVIAIALAGAWTVTTLPTEAFARCGETCGAVAPASHFSIHEILIPSYADADRVKHWEAMSVARQAAGSLRYCKGGGAWFNAGLAAINRVTVFDRAGGNWIAGSRCSLYGMS